MAGSELRLPARWQQQQGQQGQAEPVLALSRVGLAQAVGAAQAAAAPKGKGRSLLRLVQKMSDRGLPPLAERLPPAAECAELLAAYVAGVPEAEGGPSDTALVLQKVSRLVGGEGHGMCFHALCSCRLQRGTWRDAARPKPSHPRACAQEASRALAAMRGLHFMRRLLSALLRPLSETCDDAETTALLCKQTKQLCSKARGTEGGARLREPCRPLSEGGLPPQRAEGCPNLSPAPFCRSAHQPCPACVRRPWSPQCAPPGCATCCVATMKAEAACCLAWSSAASTCRLRSAPLWPSKPPFR